MENFDLNLFVRALGLAMAIEGALWAGFPDRMREAAFSISQMPGSGVRVAGLVFMLAGVGVCALVS
ncbi:MAG: DUF2065 domain-containing protein [Desulfovibrionaceae bacterium]|nr:DUF2065 domain-containing protein [Desulfovibrionaceae bacterium]